MTSVMHQLVNHAARRIAESERNRSATVENQRYFGYTRDCAPTSDKAEKSCGSRKTHALRAHFCSDWIGESLSWEIPGIATNSTTMTMIVDGRERAYYTVVAPRWGHERLVAVRVPSTGQHRPGPTGQPWVSWVDTIVFTGAPNIQETVLRQWRSLPPSPFEFARNREWKHLKCKILAAKSKSISGYVWYMYRGKILSRLILES